MVSKIRIHSRYVSRRDLLLSQYRTAENPYSTPVVYRYDAKTATFWIYVADQHKRNTYYMRLAKEQRRRSVSPYTTYGYQTGYFVHKENTLMDIVIKQPYKLPYYFW